MSTACVVAIRGGMLDRSYRGSAAEADNAADVRDCTMREDTESSIKKSILKRNGWHLQWNLAEEKLELIEEAAESDNEDESYPNE